MKKLCKGLLIVLAVILVTGCGEKSGSKRCILKQTQTDYTIESVFDIDYKGKEVTKVTTTESIESTNKEILEGVKKTVEETYKDANQKYGGYTFTYRQENNKMIFTTIIDYEKMDLTKYVNDNTAVRAYMNKNNMFTLDGLTKMYSALGAICE